MSTNNLLRTASIVAGLLILAQSVALGHQTRFVGDQTLITVEAPTISKAYYARLGGAPAIYRIPSGGSYDLYVGLYIPCMAGADRDVVVEILQDGTPLATLDGGQHSDWKPFHEPFSGDDFILGPEFRTQVLSGEIEIRVHSPDNTGPYLLAVGEAEAWPLSELIHTLASLPSLKRSYFLKPVWTAYFNLLGLGLLIVTLAFLSPIGLGIWILRRRKARRRGTVPQTVPSEGLNVVHLVDAAWALTPEQVLSATESNRDGLESVIADQRLAEHGRNALLAKDVEPWYRLFLQQFANPLVYILIVAAFVKAYFKGPADAAVIGAVLLFMALVGFAQEMKARKAMAALLSLSAPRAKVRRDGNARLMDAAEIVPGDVLVLEAGDRVAADARLIEAASLSINESTFTGESLPVPKEIQAISADAQIHDRRNMVFMGTTVAHGRALSVVTATGMQTEIGRIAHAVDSAEKEKTPLQRSIEKLGNALIWVVVSACAVLAVVALAHGMGWSDVLLLAVAAAVSGIPEGLPAAVTVVLAVCVNRMAQRNVIIRRLTAVETLGTATIICSDKTGTLTLNQMTVRGIWTGGRHLTVTGSGYEPVGDFLHDGNSLDPKDDEALLQLLRGASLCNDALLNATDKGYSSLGDPTEGALLAAAGKAGLIKAELDAAFPRLGEIPFESGRQFMVTLHAEGDRRVVYVKGSLERVLPMCAHSLTSEGARDLDATTRQKVLEANEILASQALRVLAVASAPYPVSVGRLDVDRLPGRLILLGLVGMMDPPREEARRAVQDCKKAGVRVAMITGDSPRTAAAIAAELGICSSGDEAIVGRDIEGMDDETLSAACRIKSVFARIEPLHKLRIVEAFKREGHVTAMTGDGVNDAPALEAAGIGIAMGITGTDVAKESADMVLADDNFASIVAAVEEGRVVFNRLRNVAFFLLMTCTGELMTLFLSIAAYGEAPLEPIQILWINLVTGAMVAIPLGLEPGTGKELSQPPRDSRVGLLYPGMVLRIAFAGLLLCLPTVWIFHHAPLPAVDGASAHTIRQTIVFTGIVIFEWFFAFQARSTEKGVLKLGLFRNRSLILCMIIGLGLQTLVVYLPGANRIFHTQPMTPVEWGWALLPGLLAVTIEALRKWVAPHLFTAGQWKPLRQRQ